MSRDYLVLDIVAGRYKFIGKDLVILWRSDEPPESWFDATTVSIAKGNKISLTEAFVTNSAKLNPNDAVDRFEVIDDTGRAYVKGSIYGTPVSVELSYQDDGKTLKVFVKNRDVNKKIAHTVSCTGDPYNCHNMCSCRCHHE